MRVLLLPLLSVFTLFGSSLTDTTSVYPGEPRFLQLANLQKLAREYAPVIRQLYDTILEIDVLKNVAAHKLRVALEADMKTNAWMTEIHDALVDLTIQKAMEHSATAHPVVRIAKQNDSKLASSSTTESCPLHCDVASCDMTRSEIKHGPADENSTDLEFKPTCYKPELDTTSRVQCASFEDPATLTCPHGMRRCAEIIPDGHLTFNMNVNSSTPKNIVITGINLSKCVRLAIVPEGRRCDDNRNDILDMILTSQSLLDGNPTPLNDAALIPYRDTDDNEIRDALLFKNIAVKIPGKYNLCLIQWAHRPASSNAQILHLPGAVILGVYQADKLHVFP